MTEKKKKKFEKFVDTLDFLGVFFDLAALLIRGIWLLIRFFAKLSN